MQCILSACGGSGLAHVVPLLILGCHIGDIVCALIHHYRSRTSETLQKIFFFSLQHIFPVSPFSRSSNRCFQLFLVKIETFLAILGLLYVFLLLSVVTL